LRIPPRNISRWVKQGVLKKNGGGRHAADPGKKYIIKALIF